MISGKDKIQRRRKFIAKLCVCAAVICVVMITDYIIATDYASKKPVLSIEQFEGTYFSVTFFNKCSYPVEITVSQHFSTYPKPLDSSVTYIKKANLEVAQDTEIFSGFALPDGIHKNVPDDFRLEISANDKTVSLDKAQFVEALKKIEYFDREYEERLFGIIADPSLCP